MRTTSIKIDMQLDYGVYLSTESVDHSSCDQPAWYKHLGMDLRCDEVCDWWDLHRSDYCCDDDSEEDPIVCFEFSTRQLADSYCVRYDAKNCQVQMQTSKGHWSSSNIPFSPEDFATIALALGNVDQFYARVLTH